MNTLTTEEFQDLFDEYAQSFGHTFTTFGLVPGMPAFDLASIEMARCLEQERSRPITDQDLGLEHGEGVYDLANNQDSIRPSCWDCVNKHVGSAIVLMQEAEHGYPEHKLLAIGHLAQAEEESLRQMPDVAAALREIRRRYHAGDAIDVTEFYDALGMNADSILSDNVVDSVLEHLDQQCGRGWEGNKPGCVRAKSKRKAPAPKEPKKAKQSKQSTPRPGSVTEIDPNAIAVDPKRFQYKLVGEHTKTGEVGSLSGVKRYDPNLAGIIQVWVDPADNKTYVVNGHNRLALANRLGADAVTVRYLDVKDAAEARAVGALTNIAEGRGTALDAAKFFKDTGLTKEDLDRKGIPMREKIATDGIALSKLNDNLFRKVIDGELPTERAVIIGGNGLTAAQQNDLFDLAEKQSKRGRKITNDVLQELVDGVKAADEQTETQFNLFGASEVQTTNAIERASLQAAVKKRLSRDKKLFGVVSKSKAAKDLAEAGNVIDVESSSKISKQAASTLAVFDQLKNTRGGVSDALNEAANRIKQGDDRKSVEKFLYDRIHQAIRQELGQ